ncbi:MAG: hypothetical protein ACKPKO_42295, partial [Candidatus Fonsibacter sp.]
KAQAKPGGYECTATGAIEAVEAENKAREAKAKAKTKAAEPAAKAKPLGQAAKAAAAVAAAKAAGTYRPPSRTTRSIAKPSDLLVHDQAISSGLPVAEIYRIHKMSVPMLKGELVRRGYYVRTDTS